MFRRFASVGVLALLAVTACRAPVAVSGDHFTLSRAFLDEIARQGLIVELPVRFVATGAVHPVQNDCEMHWAATSAVPLGDPAGLVTEPPNVCRSWPPTGRPAGGRRRVTWRDYAQSTLLGRDCVVRGFPRLAAEHAGGGAPSTPPHVVEIHPLLAVSGPGIALDFTGELRAVPGMVHKRPAVSEPTVGGRRLWVRAAGGDYQFRDNGAGDDWNFAIVDVDRASARMRPVRGGHRLDARVRFRADGPQFPLTLYTLSGTAADARAVTWTTSPAGDWHVLGLLTYDPLAVLGAVRDAGGSWRAPRAWTEVTRPLALVVWGETTD